MSGRGERIAVYLEVGGERTFAGAIDWPGWCRSGRDEAGALAALLAYGPRYARVLHSVWLGFAPPDDVAAFAVSERLRGGVGTDFGAPGVAPASDALPLDEPELARLKGILQACWQAYDAAIALAEGKELRTGPRGGGRDLEHIIQHVLDADLAYLRRIAWTVSSVDADARRRLGPVRQDVLAALDRAAREGLPPAGPRGGALWTPRYFVRRSAWHVLDHTWEIEDRVA